MLSGAKRRWFWCGGLRISWRYGWLVAAALMLSRSAFAGVFRYVDRDGYAHELNIVRGAEEAHAPAPVGARRTTEVPPVYMEVVREAAQLYSLPVELILAVMTVESGFNARAVSPRGAMGLMQLMPATATELHVVDPFNPRENTLGGARHLRLLLNASKGDVPLALAAYHAGAGATQRHGGVPPFPETQRYITSVIRAYQLYQERGAAFASVMADMIRAKKEVDQVGSKSIVSTPPEKAADHSRESRARTAKGKDRSPTRHSKKRRRGGKS